MAATSLNPSDRISPPREKLRTPPHLAYEPGIHQALIERAMPEIVARLSQRRRERLPAVPRCEPASRTEPEALVDALFEASSRPCETIARAAPSRGDPQVFARDLLAPAARLVGERWCSDERDFLAVTIALSRIQRLFDRAVAETPPVCAADPDRRMLLAPVPGEQHGFGLAVVEDALRRAGWTVDRCVRGDGSELFRLAASCRYRIIGISVGGEASSSGLKSLVTRLRARSLDRSAVMMAGGCLVSSQPESAVQAGFDLVAADAESGVRLAGTVAPHGVEIAALRAA